MTPTTTEPVLSAGVVAGIVSAIGSLVVLSPTERGLLTAGITLLAPILLSVLARRFAWSPATMAQVVGELRAALPHPMEVEQATGNGKAPAGVVAPDLGITPLAEAPTADQAGPSATLH